MEKRENGGSAQPRYAFIEVSGRLWKCRELNVGDREWRRWSAVEFSGDG